MTRDAVAAALDEIGTLLALQGENDFRTKAYHSAARVVAELDADLAELVRTNRLAKVRGLGDALAEKVGTLVTTGRLPFLEELRAAVPVGLREMLTLPGVGPKKVRALHDALGVTTLAQLQAACEAGRVAGVKVFGEKMQAKLLAAILFRATVGGRVLFGQADRLADALGQWVRTMPGVTAVQVCGEVRRRTSTVERAVLVAASTEPERVVDAFAACELVEQVVERDAGRASVVAAMEYRPGRVVRLPAVLWVTPHSTFGNAVLVATGSDAHVRRLEERGYTDYEDIADEADVYRALGLAWIPPELREDTGEIEAAGAGTLPRLIEHRDLRGALHNHTTESDGRATLEEMADAARALGWEYFGVGDHSQSLTVANGLTPARVRRQWDMVDRLNRKYTGFRILKGTECDILKDGSLDFSDELLAGFDYVVASVHSHFDLSEAEQTARVCRALAHPAVTILGHPTGRLLLRREGYKLEIETVLQAAARHGKMVEINAQPDRLDLDWPHLRRAKELGIPLVINPDAHSPAELALVRYGVDAARRGWLTAADVFNAKGLTEVLAELHQRKSEGGAGVPPAL